jgi:hypothetical protein
MKDVRDDTASGGERKQCLAEQGLEGKIKRRHG